MKRGSFILDGVNSEDLNTLIQYRPLIEAPLRKVEMKSTYGVDGDVPYDEGAYSNTSMELVLVINGDNVIADRQAVYNLLDGRGVYKEFIPYFDPEKIYRVMLLEPAKFENNFTYGNIQAAAATFTVKPYKYLVSNDPITITTGSGSVTNPTNYVAQPKITIKGTGAVVLNVNGIPFNISDLPNEITLDSERFSAYQEDVNGILTPMNHKVTSREYPIFKPGVNTITVTGTVTQLYIEPRWRSLV